MDELQTRIEALRLAQEWVLSFDTPQHEDVLPLADLYCNWVLQPKSDLVGWINPLNIMDYGR